ncbi:hypothetical protein JTF06_05760 [Desemzia sp. RIT804]|uniref:hypothetical protein n=1 Tax=Desemzia sp. RIT 804 TaxID=2810209 RepID=UPI00194E90F7|nr:hypothetical protein [Desemzia sp. RIT 804]MBM6614392.1 hypothetical protein [Desemzia sp. RIT 804]
MGDEEKDWDRSFSGVDFSAGWMHRKKEEALEKVQAAAHNSQSILNATFLIETITENDTEQVKQQVKGGFIKNGEDDYDLHYKTYGGDEGINVISEYAVIDGEEYDRILFDGEAESEWFQHPEPSDLNFSYLTVFFENSLTVSDIEKVEVSETTEYKQYTFVMSETYNERLKSENVKAVADSIEFMTENDMDAEIIDKMEEQLQINQNTNFQQQQVIYQVNEEDFLINVNYHSTIVPPDGQIFSLTNTSSITDYHLSDISQLIPIIEIE